MPRGISLQQALAVVDRDESFEVWARRLSHLEGRTVTVSGCQFSSPAPARRGRVKILLLSLEECDKAHDQIAMFERDPSTKPSSMVFPTDAHTVLVELDAADAPSDDDFLGYMTVTGVFRLGKTVFDEGTTAWAMIENATWSAGSRRR